MNKNEKKEIARVKCVYCGKEYILYDDDTSFDTWFENDELSKDYTDEPVCRRCLKAHLKPLLPSKSKNYRRK